MNVEVKETVEFGIPLKGIGCGQGGANIVAGGNNIGLFEQIAGVNTTTSDEMSIPLANQHPLF